MDIAQRHQVEQRLRMPKLVSVCGDGLYQQKRQQVGASITGETCPKPQFDDIKL
jgi:hypothetical protein